MNLSKAVIGIVGVVFLFVFVFLSGNLLEQIDAGEIGVFQAPVSGELTIKKEAGLYWQGFAKVTHYPKSLTYWFSKETKEGKSNIDQSIKVRFNDGGHGSISGSVRIDLPNEDEFIKWLHTKFGSAQNIEAALIRTTMEKAVYMSGPLMSSKESNAERRAQLIQFIEDQAVNGVYKTQSKETRIKDPITNVEKTTTIVELIMDPKSPSGIARQETSSISDFRLKFYNLSINSIDYDATVQKQIEDQQKIAMEVQTKLAQSKMAEQDAITAEQQGKASATRAKWEQETLKAKEVTRAEQEAQVAKIAADREKAVAETKALQQREVAKLNMEAADFYKNEQLLRAKGDSEYKKQIMEADGALTQKLATYEKSIGLLADAIKNHQGPWVPSIIMGSNSNGNNNAAMDFMSIITAKTLQDLGLDLSANHVKKIK